MFQLRLPTNRFLTPASSPEVSSVLDFLVDASGSFSALRFFDGASSSASSLSESEESDPDSSSLEDEESELPDSLSESSYGIVSRCKKLKIRCGD